VIDPACNDCRNTVAGCPAHKAEEAEAQGLASDIIRELLERDAPEEEPEDDGSA
jgi:hypothetical protein